MSKGMRDALILLFAVIELLVVALIAIPFIAPTDAFRQAAEEAASEMTGVRVKVGAIALQILPAPVLSLFNLSMEDKQGGVPLLVAASCKLSLALEPLLDGDVLFSDIFLAGIGLRVSEQSRGEYVHVVHINSITGAAAISGERLEALNWNAELYSGTVRMNAVLSQAKGEQQTIVGKLVAEGIQIQPLLYDASGKKNLSGTFSGALDVSTRGETEKSLRGNLKVDGPIRMKQGKIEDIGLDSSAVALAHGNIAGDAIFYDVMKFNFKMRGKNRWLNHIVLKTSHLDAEGHVKIAANKKIEGEIITSGIGGLAGASLLIAGTTDNIRVSPAPSSLIGSVIGGAVGGPVGAGIGSKIGNKVGEMMQDIGKTVKDILVK
jgi:uncharacterized protein involved in outer membrane biogenesis